MPSDLIVLNLIRGAVPERADEISRLWRTYDPTIEVAPSRKGVTMDADKDRIRFDIKTVEVFWLVGFSAWRSIETYVPVVVLGPIARVSIDEFLAKDPGLPEFEHDYKDRLAAAQSIIVGKDTDFGKWPPDILRPQDDRNSMANEQDKLAFDLVCLALGSAFFHEFRHVMFLNDGTAPANLPEEEIACDVWSRAFLTDKLAVYAKEHGHDYEAVLTKRAMGIALGAVVVHAITPWHVHWGNTQYPPIAERIEALIGNMNLPDHSSFWIFTACLLIAIMRQTHRPLDFVPTTPRRIVEEIVARMR